MQQDHYQGLIQDLLSGGEQGWVQFVQQFSKLPIVLKSTLDQLKILKESRADWCSSAQLAISEMESTAIGRTQSTTTTSVDEFQKGGSGGI